MPRRRRRRRTAGEVISAGLATGARGQFLGPRASTLLPTTTLQGQTINPLAPQITQNPTIARTTEGDVVELGTRDFGIEEVQRDFRAPSALDLVLSREQQSAISNLQTSAGAGGLFGGAVTGQVRNLSQRFLAANQATGFRNVVSRAEDVRNQLFGGVKDFLSQIGGLISKGDEGIEGVSRIATAGQENLQKFAQPLIKALVSSGQQRALEAGLAMGTPGVDISSFNLSGQERGLAQAVSQFLNPSLSQEQRTAITESITRIGRGAGISPGRNLSLQRTRQTLSTTGVAGQRVAAGKQLRSALSEPLSQFNAAVEELRSNAEALTFLATTGQGPQDLSVLGPLFNTLGG
jgi:hypothetical protein